MPIRRSSTPMPRPVKQISGEVARGTAKAPAPPVPAPTASLPTKAVGEDAFVNARAGSKAGTIQGGSTSGPSPETLALAKRCGANGPRGLSQTGVNVGGTVAHLSGFRGADLSAGKHTDSRQILEQGILEQGILEQGILEQGGASLLERFGAARKASAQKRNQAVVQNLLPDLQTDQQRLLVVSASGTSNKASRVLKAKCEMLGQVVASLEDGERLGACVDQVNGALREANRSLGDLIKEDLPRTQAETNANHSGSSPKRPANVQAAEDRLEGLFQALADVQGQVKGWRGISLTLESGLSIGIPFIGGASLSLGLKLVGPDAGGGPMVRPYVKVAAGGGVGVVGAGGAYVLGRGMKGGGYNFGTTYLSYTPKDPVTGRNLKATLPGVGAAMVTENGFAAGGRLPVLGIAPNAFMQVEHPTLAASTGKVFDAVDRGSEKVREFGQSMTSGKSKPAPAIFAKA